MPILARPCVWAGLSVAAGQGDRSLRCRRPADVTARQIGSILQESFGQPFVIENRTGAGGVIGTLEVAKSPPDGYTLLMMSNTQTANESLVPQRKYELMRDLAPIAPVNYSDLVIVVHPAVQAKTLQEFIALPNRSPAS